MPRGYGSWAQWRRRAGKIDMFTSLVRCQACTAQQVSACCRDDSMKWHEFHLAHLSWKDTRQEQWKATEVVQLEVNR